MTYTNIAYTPIECENNLGCAYNKFMETFFRENVDNIKKLYL